MCAKKCQCVDCVFSGVADVLSAAEQIIAKEQTIAATIAEEQSMDTGVPRSIHNKKIMKEKIKEYRSGVCSTSSLLYGIEIGTGIPDYLIEEITENTYSIEQLMQLGLSSKDASAIDDIINITINS